MGIRRFLCSMLPGFLLLSAAAWPASVIVGADDGSDAYGILTGALGSNAVEAPDCSHADFGPHILRAPDPELGASSFVFHLHLSPDNDRCLLSDRQRNEIKIDDKSAEPLKAVQGDTMTYRWQFRLDEGFQAAANFTHLHQISATGSDQPLVTLTARRKATETLELIHIDSLGTRTLLHSIDLQPFRGEWIDAVSTVTAAHSGRYALTLTRRRDGVVLLAYDNGSIDMWRDDARILRPKWGIYRSLLDTTSLRDEQLRFGRFCIGKGSEVCPPLTRAAAPVFSPTPGSYDTPQSVALGTATTNAVIRFSSDGTVPDCARSNTYDAPLPITATTALSAIACRSDLAASPVTTATYVINSAPLRFTIPRNAVTASSAQNKAGNTVDGLLLTRWLVDGDGQWLRYDLQAKRLLSHMRIAWYRGHTVRYRFEIQVSEDGSNFSTAFSGESSGGGTARETYDIPDAAARYVRIVGHGSSANQSTGIAETEIYGY